MHKTQPLSTEQMDSMRFICYQWHMLTYHVCYKGVIKCHARKGITWDLELFGCIIY